MNATNGTQVGHVDHSPCHRHCTRRIRALTLLARMQRSALVLIAGFSDDPKAVNVARRALGNDRW